MLSDDDNKVDQSAGGQDRIPRRTATSFTIMHDMIITMKNLTEQA